jgi:hypothetical protein
VEFDRQSIERHDFPIARKGYDTAAVDAHLRALAEWTQELAQRAASATEPSLGTTAATRVQGILEAAQAAASEIAGEAQREAQRTREDAARVAEHARAHVDTLAQASTAILAQVQSLDGELSALAQSLRAGREASGDEQPQSAPPEPAPTLTLVPEPAPTLAARPEPAPTLAAPPEPIPQAVASQRGEDLDGARLVALNMALSGEPRERTDRYLADSFQLADRAKLLDEVYAAVEG